MYPFASLPENLAAFCEALRRQHGFRIGPGELHDAARALDVVDLADERAVRHALRPILARHAGRRRRSSTRRSRSSSFPAPRVFARIRCPPRGGSPGPTPTAARRTPQHARHAPPSAADADEASGRGRRSDDAARVERRWARRGGDLRAIELQPARRRRGRRARVAARRARLARCRAIVRSPAASRPVAPLAAGDAGDDASTFDARCAPACRPAARRCRRAGCAARGGRRDSCCWSTAAAR